MSTSVSVASRSAGARRRDDRRLHILRIAAQTFNEVGFQRATLDDVAARLGVTKPALYYYFRSKDEMLALCAQIAIRKTQAGVERLELENLNGFDRLWRFFTLWTDVICDDFGRCLVQTLPRDLAAGSREENISGRREIESVVRGYLELGMSDESVRKCDPAMMAKFLFDTFNGIARWFHPDGELTRAEISAEYIETLKPGLKGKSVR